MAKEKKEATAEHNEKKKKKKKKKNRKPYYLPGQKYDPPEERDCLRIFYETLYRKLPDNEMAASWMMENGLLPMEEAKKVYEKKKKRKQEHNLGSAVEESSSVNRSVDSVNVAEMENDPSSGQRRSRCRTLKNRVSVEEVQ